jgi:hypothetical protein
LKTNNVCNDKRQLSKKKLFETGWGLGVHQLLKLFFSPQNDTTGCVSENGTFWF